MVSYWKWECFHKYGQCLLCCVSCCCPSWPLVFSLLQGRLPDAEILCNVLLSLFNFLSFLLLSLPLLFPLSFIPKLLSFLVPSTPSFLFLPVLYHAFSHFPFPLPSLLLFSPSLLLIFSFDVLVSSSLIYNNRQPCFSYINNMCAW